MSKNFLGSFLLNGIEKGKPRLQGEEKIIFDAARKQLLSTGKISFPVLYDTLLVLGVEKPAQKILKYTLEEL